MAEVTAALVKELREKTGVGMMDCKKALAENDGDLEASIDWLRAKGLSKAAKKADRAAAEGLVAIAAGADGVAVVELNSETDFVARNETFQKAARAFAQLALKAKGDHAALLASPAPDGEGNVQDMVTGFVVPRRNSALMAERLAMLAGDPEMRQLMGEAGRERVTHFFRVDQEIDAFERLYFETLDRRLQAHRLLARMKEMPPPQEPDILTLIRLEEDFTNRASML